MNETTSVTPPSAAAGTKQKGEAKTARIPIKIVPAERLKKPDWIRVRAPSSARFYEIKRILREHNLHTVCEEASCPNIGECFGKGTATFMIMGDVCTRRCPFCDVGHGRPLPLGCPRARQPRQDHRRTALVLRRHHQRRPRRSSRRRRAAFRRLHPRRARILAGDTDRSAGARFSRTPRSRARGAHAGAAGHDEPQSGNRAATLQAGAARIGLCSFAQAAQGFQGAISPCSDQVGIDGWAGRNRRRTAGGVARHARSRHRHADHRPVSATDGGSSASIALCASGHVRDVRARSLRDWVFATRRWARWCVRRITRISRHKAFWKPPADAQRSRDWRTPYNNSKREET